MTTCCGWCGTPFEHANSASRKFCSIDHARKAQMAARTEQWWKDNYRRGKKRCRKCERWLSPSENFHKKAAGTDDLNNKCKECACEETRVYNAINPRLRQISRATKKYNITVEEYLKLEKSQRGRCAICRNKPKTKSLHVDHCHKTGRVRRLLCSRCNLVLGQVGDDPKLLMRMAEYVGS